MPVLIPGTVFAYYPTISVIKRNVPELIGGHT